MKRKRFLKDLSPFHFVDVGGLSMTTWKAAVALSRSRQLQTTTSKFSFFLDVLLGICIEVNH